MSTPLVDPLRELLRATGLGDQIAFAELYRLTSGKLYAIAHRMLRRADTASEALQEAYLQIWTQSDRYDPAKGQAIQWMAGIIHRVCIDMLRRSKSQLSPGPNLDEVEQVIPPHDIASVDIERCLRHLDAMQSKAILMAFYYGFSHAALAKMLAVPLGTMKSTIRRGLASLRQCLDAGDPNA